MTKLPGAFRPADVQGDAASVMPPGHPSPYRYAHDLICLDGRWYYKSWRFGKPEEMMKSGKTLRRRAEQTDRWLDRVEPLLDQSSTAAELKRKIDARSRSSYGTRTKADGSLTEERGCPARTRPRHGSADTRPRDA